MDSVRRMWPAALLAFAVAPLRAQAPLSDQGQPMASILTYAYDPATLLDTKADLSLTEAQISKLEALAGEVRMAKQHAQAEHDLRLARILEEFKLAVPDPAKVKADAQEAMQDMAAAYGIEVAAAARAKGLLTDAQRAKVDSWVGYHERMMRGAPGVKPEKTERTGLR